MTDHETMIRRRLDAAARFGGWCTWAIAELGRWTALVLVSVVVLTVGSVAWFFLGMARGKQ